MQLAQFREFDFQNQLLQTGDKILWLGALDQLWMTYLSGVVGSGGKLIWVDRAGGAGELPPNVVYLREDIQRCDLSTFKEHVTLFDVVAFGVSDADSAVDADRQGAVLEVIRSFLKREGTFLGRAMNETDVGRWEKHLKAEFSTVSLKEPTRGLLVASNYRREN